MSKTEDFEIENGVLVKYTGSGGDIVLPEGITEIGRLAFHGCSGLTGVVLPEGVTVIDGDAFFYCEDLTVVEIPDSVTEIRSRAFDICKGLKEIRVSGRNPSYTAINGILFDKEVTTLIRCPENQIGQIVLPGSVRKIEDDAFFACSGLTGVVLPEGVTEIGQRAFNGCSALEEFCIPKGMTRIGEGAFNDCRSLRAIHIPEGVTKIGTWAFLSCTGLEELWIPDSVENIGTELLVYRSSTRKHLKKLRLPRGLNLEKGFFAGLSVDRVELELQGTDKLPLEYAGALPSMDVQPEDAAELMIRQTTAQWWPPIMKCIEQQNIDRNAILVALAQRISSGKKPTAGLEKRITEYLDLNLDLLTPDSLQAMMDCLKLKKSKLAAALEDNDRIKRQLAGAEAIQSPENLHPVEKLVAEQFRMTRELAALRGAIKKGIPYADGSGTSSVEAVLFVLGECLNSSDQAQLDNMAYWKDVLAFSFSEAADRVVEGLKRPAFLKLMRKLVEDEMCVQAALALGSYGGEEEAAFLTYRMDGWKQTKTRVASRRNQILGRTALLNSDTAKAILYFESKKDLDRYAEHHHTDRQTLWFTRIMELGFDAEGSLVYDLGKTQLQVTLQPDLSLELYDRAAGKTVKRVPKKDIDPRLYAHVTDELKELKKQLKFVVRHGCNMLLKDFTGGTEVAADLWQLRYRGAVQRCLAQALVWEQGGRTFRPSEQGPVDDREEPVVLQPDQPIRLAHPMELEPAAVTAWQKYFTAHGIRQPFLQIWEPVIDFSQVRDDRYAGCLIPWSWLRNQEKRGIELTVFHDSTGCMDYVNVSFKDCTYDVDQPDTGDQLEIRKLHPEQRSRCSNNIIAFLDFLTVRQRLEQDDASIGPMLNSFTLAQVTEFIKIATENSCTNVTALLLNYKNEHFADFDPMEEFTLDDL